MEASTAAKVAVKIGADLSEFESKMNRAESRLRTGVNNLRKIGAGLTLGLTVPLLGLGAATAKTGMNFDKAMFGVNSVLKLNARQFAKLKQQVLDFSTTTSQSSVEVAGALRLISSYNYDAADSMTILRIAVDAAGNMMSDTATTTRAITGVLKAYSLSADHARQVSDELETAVNKSGMSFDMLSQGIGNVTGVAAAAHIGLESVLGALMTMKQRGYDVYEGITSVRAAILTFLNPSKDLTKVVKSLGYNSAYAMLRAKGFQGAMEALDKAVHGNAASMSKLFPNVRALKAALAVSGEGAKAFTQNLKELDKATLGIGEHERMRAIRHQSAAYHLAKLRSEMEVFTNRIASVMLPTFVKLTDKLKNFFETLANLTPRGQKTVVMVAAIAAGIGPLILAVTTAISIFSALAGTIASVAGVLAATVPIIGAPVLPVLALAGAVGFLAYAFATNFHGIRTTVAGGIHDIAGRISDGAHWLVKTTGGLATSVIKLVTSLWDGLDKMTGGALGRWLNMYKEGFKYLFGGFKKAFLGIDRVVGHALAGVVRMAGNALASVEDTLAGFVEKIPGLGPTLASGMRSMADSVRGTAGSVASALEGGIGHALEGLVLDIGNFASSIPSRIGNATQSILTEISKLMREAKSALGLAPRAFVSGDHDLNKFLHKAQEARLNAKDLKDVLSTKVPPGLGDAAAEAAKKTDALGDALHRAGMAVKLLDYKFKKGLIDQVGLLSGKIQALKGLLDVALERGAMALADKTTEKIKKLQAQLDKLNKTKTSLPEAATPTASLSALANYTDAFQAAMAGLRKMVTKTDIGDVIGSIDGFLAQVDELIAKVASHKVSDDTLTAVRRYSVAAGAVSATIRDAVAALKVLGDYVPTPGAGALTAKLVTFTKVIAGQMAIAADELTGAGMLKAKMFSESVAGVFGVLRDAVEALKAIKPDEWELPHAGELSWKLVRFAKEVARQMAAAATGFKDDVLPAAHDFALAVAPVGGVLKDAVGALQAMKEQSWELPHAGELTWKLVRFAKEVAMQMAAAADRLGGDTMKSAKAMAVTASAVLSPVRDAVSALEAIGKYTAIKGLEVKTAVFLGDLLTVTNLLAYAFADTARSMSDKVAAGAKKFAATAQAVLAPVRDGTSALKAIAAYVPAADLGTRANQVAAGLLTVTDILAYAFADSARNMGDKVAPQADKFAALSQQVIAPVQGGIDAIKAIGKYTAPANLAAGTVSVASDLVTVTNALAAAFNSAAGGMADKVQKAASNYASTVSAVVAPVQSGLEAIKAIGAYTSPANLSAAVGEVAADLVEVADSLAVAFSAAAAKMSSDTRKAAMDYASMVGAVLAPIQPAFDAFKTIARYGEWHAINKIAPFTSDLTALADSLATAFSNSATKLGGNVLKNAEHYASVMMKVVDAVRNGLKLLYELRYYKTTDYQNAIMAFTNDMADTLDAMSRALVPKAYGVGYDLGQNMRAGLQAGLNGGMNIAPGGSAGGSGGVTIAVYGDLYITASEAGNITTDAVFNALSG